MPASTRRRFRDRCRRAAARRRACARARRRRQPRADAAAARRARRRARARPGPPSAGASGTSTSRRTARGSGRRTSRPGGTASCVTPETPSSAFGRSTPCQWIETPSSDVAVHERRLDEVSLADAQLRARHAAVERQRADSFGPTAAGSRASARRAGTGRPAGRPARRSAATERRVPRARRPRRRRSPSAPSSSAPNAPGTRLEFQATPSQTATATTAAMPATSASALAHAAARIDLNRFRQPALPPPRRARRARTPTRGSPSAPEARRRSPGASAATQRPADGGSPARRAGSATSDREPRASACSGSQASSATISSSKAPGCAMKKPKSRCRLSCFASSIGSASPRAEDPFAREVHLQDDQQHVQRVRRSAGSSVHTRRTPAIVRPPVRRRRSRLIGPHRSACWQCRQGRSRPMIRNGRPEPKSRYGTITCQPRPR